MKVIIPLAGKGTRLRPQTYHTPKPLLHVGGRPVMSYILDDLKALGVERVETVVARENFGLLGFFYDAAFEQSRRLSFDKRVA